MPKKCCSCCCNGYEDDNDVVRPDECMCGCGYLNGPFQVMLGQLLLMIGFFFSIAAVGDCSFVDTAIPVRVYGSGGGVDRFSNSLGFFMYKNFDTGYCYYWSDTSFASIEDQITFYINNVLGPDWYQSINLASTASCISFLFFLYVTSYCCSSQIKPFRYTTGFFIGIVVTIFQGLAFLVYNSDWCDTYQCSFGRSAGFAVGAAVCFFLSGIMWCMTSDYPGVDVAGGASPPVSYYDNDAEQAQIEVEHNQEPYAVTGVEANNDDNEDNGAKNTWQSY